MYSICFSFKSQYLLKLTKSVSIIPLKMTMIVAFTWIFVPTKKFTVLLTATVSGNTKGGLYECAIADALYKAGYKLYFYKNDTARRELDFLIQKEGRVIPIEVKSNNNKATSLTSVVRNKQDVSFGYKFIDGNIGQSEDGIVSLPLYMSGWV